MTEETRIIGSTELTFESGKFASQAHGAAVVTLGETQVLATCVTSKPREGIDFFPLTVDVEERMYAAGKIPGSFFRREGRPSETAILTARLTDRPLRPTFKSGYRDEVQVVATILSADMANPYDIPVINAAGLAVPLVVVGVGVVILWRQADDTQRERWRAATATHRVPAVVRAGLGITLILVGGAAILIGPARLNGTSGGLVAAIVVTIGLALVSGPWWMRMVRDLNAERSARIREQERAEVAAHVHDSVLHTLTLIQRHVDNPREVARLARAQERELRGWLYRPRRTDPTATVTTEVDRVAAEVEDAHGVAIEVVVVGDAPLDDSLGALLHATREALVNAAKYARDSPISVYVEVEPDQVTVFVRDRGPGFDPAAVPEDRMGLRQSVVGRMQRHGGVATIRSADGEGTEVQLEMPRSAS